MQKLLSTLGVFFIIFIVLAGIGTYINRYEPTEEAKTNTGNNLQQSYYKQQFVKGCTEEGAEATWCSCGYDAMVGLYGPDWGLDTTITSRILDSGFTKAETDTFIEKCGLATTAEEV